MNNNILAEPYLRNSDIISLDMSSIRRAEFSGSMIMDQMVFLPMKCQIAKYAGISDKLSNFITYNFSKKLENHEVELTAQIFYFIIDGYCHRKSYPIGTKKNHVKYAVFMKLNYNLVFHKSPSLKDVVGSSCPPLKDLNLNDII